MEAALKTIRVAAALVAALVTVATAADEIQGTGLLFTAPVRAPGLLTWCEDSLWAYSTSENALLRLGGETGAMQEKIPASFLSEAGHLQSLTCWRGTLLAADRSNLYSLAPSAGSVRRRTPVPMKEFRAIRCESGMCVASGDRVMKSADLDRWEELPIPPSKQVDPVVDVSKENPFYNWHDRLQLSPTRYTKSALGAHGELYLLDALRSSVVVFRGMTALKWGNAGHFEGELMFPRGIALLENGDVLLSDPGLKLVFQFSASGEYRGYVGDDGKGGRFEYPVDVLVHGNTIYVADFGKDRIVALDSRALVAGGGPEERSVKTVDDLLVHDLFQNAAVQSNLERTRCLSCHDGTEVNSLRAFGGMGFHHPVGKALKPEMLARGVDLPLGPGKSVSCNSCHDGHHGSHAGEVVSRDGRVQKVDAMPFKLRKPARLLCATCHFEKSSVSANHFGLMKGRYSVKSCDQCHRPHAGFEHALVAPVPQLCLGCHTGKFDAIHAKLKAGEPTQKACLSCHALHQSSEGAHKAHFLVHAAADGAATCTSCHKELAPLLGQNAHLRSHGEKSACVSCHQPHRAVAAAPAACVSCHAGRGQIHRALIAISDTSRAKDIHLSGEKISCATCHDPHGVGAPTHLLRDRAPLLQFCSGCHGEKAPGLYENFHHRGKP